MSTQQPDLEKKAVVETAMTNADNEVVAEFGYVPELKVSSCVDSRCISNTDILFPGRTAQLFLDFHVGSLRVPDGDLGGFVQVKTLGQYNEFLVPRLTVYNLFQHNGRWLRERRSSLADLRIHRCCHRIAVFCHVSG